MGCHTWFRNKIADMPQEHLEKLKEVHIKGIKNAYIYKCSAEAWIKDGEIGLKSLEEDYPTDEDKKSELYKMEKKMLEEHSTKEYYEKAHGRYVKDLEILQNPKSTRNQILKVFSRHDLSFDKDLKNGSYEMSKVGWGDNYRISDYQCVVHHNAQEAIEWLEEYDNGNNICCDMKWGMCEEIKIMITEFFNEFPNGTIHYG